MRVLATLVYLIIQNVQISDASEGPRVWGLHGESWNRDLLLDWSFSGFAAKERGYPDPPFAANVLDFGAVGDGKMDCTGAFRSAIDHVSTLGGGTILIPEGRYRLSKRLVLSADNTVLKGVGPDATVLYYDNPLSIIDNVDVEKHLNYGYQQSPYSWNDGVIQIAGFDPGSSSRSNGNTGWVLQDSKMGQRHVIVDSVDGLVPGQWVRLLQSDTGGSLTSYLYGTDYNRISKMLEKSDDCEPECASDISNEKDLIRWISRILAIEEGNVIVFQRSLPMDVSPGWKARIMTIPDSMPKESGVRDLTVQFAHAGASRHHHDAGYNAILVSNAVNAFVHNVRTLDADQAFLVQNSQMVSLDGVQVWKTKSRKTSSMPFDGHIGVGLYDSSDVEVANFDVRGEWLHDVSVRGSMMSVFHSGRGDNLRLDTHRSAPYAILFSDIYLGEGTRAFGTGGYLSRGLPVAKYTTYYNIRNNKYKPIQLPDSTVSGPCTWGKLVNYIGKWTGTKCPGYNIELVKSNLVHPRDLFNAMIDRKNAIRGQFSSGVIHSMDSKVAKSAVDESPPRIFPAGDGSYPVLNSPEVY